MVLGRERVVLVLDDTEGVWPRHRDNLVQIERYLFFPADAGRFGFRCQAVEGRVVVVVVVRVGVGSYVRSDTGGVPARISMCGL